MASTYVRLRSVLCCLSLLVLMTACQSRTHTVRYEISGTPYKISISYVNGTGASEQRDVYGSWSVEYRVKTWSYTGISVFNPNASGTITCRMFVDGILVQEAESVGGYKWARCDGLAGITGATPTPQTGAP